MESTRAMFAISSTLRGCQCLQSFHSLYSASHYVVSIILFGLIVHYLVEFAISRRTRVKVPVLGYRCILEPTWFVRLRFVWTGGSIVRDGYERFRSSIFQIRKLGTDIVIIPPNYVDEVRKLSKDKTRSVEPFIDDFAGKYTHGMPFLQSDLQNIVIQKKLTPRLAELTRVMQEEFDLALSLEMPPMTEHEWIEVDIASLFTNLISRISARVFLGPDHCHDEGWLSTTTEYSKNLFITGFILRVIPHILRPFIAPLLPSYRQLLRNVSSARRIISSILRERETQVRNNSDQDILQFMMEHATGRERTPENLAQRMLILSLASIHTTALTMTHAIYDLCAHPEYFEPLRQEMTTALAEGGWQKTTLNRLYKLDSFLKESQRISPTFLLTFNRVFHEPINLSDGTHLPPGTRVAVPSHAMLQDTLHVPGQFPPAKFDAFRYSALREESDAISKHNFSMTDSSNMAFGYGKYACPGRFYAANEIKLVLTNLLLRYDFKFCDGQGRPRNITIDSDMFPDPRARLCVRTRSPAN
ncbi:hypothetical protein E4U56_003488 [Claviceps arundinis]|uniref:Uncharacterized protein n=1 Tax=Claviceps arundinis TaxID=1623583 RepID=A0A9P7MPN4_9HYPO|nr:hypothetical protein E4U56_003488 [Claviceps arundinis]